MITYVADVTKYIFNYILMFTKIKKHSIDLCFLYFPSIHKIMLKCDLGRYKVSSNTDVAKFEQMRR